MEKQRKATSNDVAKLAGVSQATVSRAFTPGSSISEAKKQKILEAAKKINYVPNAMARALISSHSNCIAIVQPISVNPYFYANVLQKLLVLLEENNQRVVLFNQDGKTVDEILPLIDQYQVDGVIMPSANIDAKLINQYVNRGIEFSFINRHVPNVYASSVCTNNRQAAKDLVSYLAEKGYQRFAFIAGPENTSTTVDRIEGYLAQLEALKLKNTHIIYDEFSFEGGYRSVLRLLETVEPRPDVIMCGNDEIAIGAINALKELKGLRIPEDVAVTGFDDIEAAKWPVFNLTTIRQPVEKLCEIAVNDLLARIRDKSREPIFESISAQLVERSSA